MKRDSVLLRHLIAKGINVYDLLKALGGRQHYLPSLRSYREQVRNVQISIDWDEGMGYADLCEKHGLKERQVRRILEKYLLAKRKRAA